MNNPLNKIQFYRKITGGVWYLNQYYFTDLNKIEKQWEREVTKKNKAFHRGTIKIEIY